MQIGEYALLLALGDGDSLNLPAVEEAERLLPEDV